MTTPLMPLRILHTSDWHLGRRLYGYTRYAEFTAFLDWLYQCIVTQAIDVLIVAGDIFDTMTPSNQAQALYYEFLGRISNSNCQHVVIVAGNHDSPSLLDAPKHVLKFLNVTIVGNACEDIKDEVIQLHTDNIPQAIVMAVPYLRDKDVRQSVSFESSTEQNSQLISGIKAHYQTASDIAKHQQQQIFEQHGVLVPIIATGHLFAAGGKTTDDDGVRDLYVGSLGKIGSDMFASHIDYVALGHLHVPQIVGEQQHIRYSGSPIPMGFGEATQQKQVLMVEFAINDTQQTVTKVNLDEPPIKDNQANRCYTSYTPNVTSIPIPCFQQLVQVTGNLEQITTQLTQLMEKDMPIWVEVIYQANQTNSRSDASSLEASDLEASGLDGSCLAAMNSSLDDFASSSDNSGSDNKSNTNDSKNKEDTNELIHDLNVQLYQWVENSQVEIIKIKNTHNYQHSLQQSEQALSLQDLNHHQVFERCLDANNIGEPTREALITCYQQLVYEFEHDDHLSE